jgi:hypothetical protein
VATIFALEMKMIILYDVNVLSMGITLATLNALNIGVDDGRKIEHLIMWMSRIKIKLL